jgi:hypothetical protein
MSVLATMPSLSADGWVNSSLKTADYLFSHFFASDYSQSYTYLGGVSSFAYIIQSNQKDIRGTIRNLESTLNGYFGKYFQNVVVEIDDNATIANSSKVGLNIFLNFTDDKGVTYTLGKTIEYQNAIISKIITHSNNG